MQRNTFREYSPGPVSADTERRGKGRLRLFTAVLVLLTLVLGGCSGGQSDQLQGRWDLDGTTIYAFDGRGSGAMELPESKYEFQYQIQDTEVHIDFEQQQVQDRTYTFTVDADRLTLVWEEAAEPVTYQLQKQGDSGQSS